MPNFERTSMIGDNGVHANVSVQEQLLFAIMFMAPTGMFFIPFPAVGSLRFFYFLLPIFLFISLGKLLRPRLVQLGLLFFIASILLASATYSVESGRGVITSLAENPIVRFFVILNLMIGFYFIACYVSNRHDGYFLLKLLHSSFIGFCLCFILGMGLYILYVTGKVGLDTYTRFTSLYQEAYGYVRFSPGTYPNEFGVICSFFAIYALGVYAWRNKYIYLLISAIFIVGMMLTTTRIAYITFAVGFMVMFLFYSSSRTKLKYLVFFSIICVSVFSILNFFDFNIIFIINSGYDALINDTGSSEARSEAWNSALSDFNHRILWGVGFESPLASYLHNLPLQLIYGLGLIPSVFVFLFFVLFFITNKAQQWLNVVYFHDIKDMKFAKMIRLVLGIHVFLFGLTNHNQAHFFTWFFFMLSCLSLKYRTDRPE